MARKDASSKPPIDKYRKEIGKHDKKKGDKINKAEKRQREAGAAVESAVHKWPLLILGLLSVCCGLLYLGLYFWLTVPENADFMEEFSAGFAAWKAGKFPLFGSEPESTPKEGKS